MEGSRPAEENSERGSSRQSRPETVALLGGVVPVEEGTR